MQHEAMILHGKSLFDYNNGNRAAEIILRRDDGFEDVLLETGKPLSNLEFVQK